MRRPKKRWLMVLVAAGMTAFGVTSCARDKKEAGAEALPAPVKVSPLALEARSPSGDGAFAPAALEAWSMFDRDTATGYAPALDAGGEFVLRVALGQAADLTHIKVFGSSPYVLDVLADGAAIGALANLDLSKLKAGWNALPANAKAKPEATPGTIDLRFRAKSSSAEGTDAHALPDIELWSVRSGRLPHVSAHSLQELLDRPGSLWPPQLVAADASPASATLAADQAMIEEPCATFTFALDQSPALYERAWLAYDGEGLFRAFALTRTLNNAPHRAGVWAPADGNGKKLFVEPLDPEALRLGDNQFEVCLPSDAVGRPVISAVRFIGELEHGTNAVESVAVGPVGALPTRGALSLLDPASTESHSVDSGERVLVVFNRWQSPDAVFIESSTPSWSIECLDEGGQGHALPVDVASAAGDAQLLLARPADQERLCAGIALTPSAAGSVVLKRLWVAGSGARSRIDWPRIVLASPAEHFGLEAWIDGWASAPSRLSGPVHVDVDGADMGTQEGVFARVIGRTGDPAVAWPVTVTGRFSDGTSFSRKFVLDAAGEMPLLGLGPGIIGGSSDGLTEAERRARYGTVGDSASAEADPSSDSSVRLGTHVAVDIPAGAVGNGNGNGQKVAITVAHLDASELPPLDPGLINVTAPFAHGYEFLPHGQQFNKHVKIQLPYQENLLPSGYGVEDVATYFFDETAKRWRKLTRDGHDKGRGTVRSLTDHFTVMINAVVVAPEHPQVSSFNPTEIKDIQAANPSAKVNLIEPPQATSKGDAMVSYPFEVPPGRGGLQPEVALAYNSSGENSWAGMGWDLPRRSITIDTRWGVPRYRSDHESETYMLEGEQLTPMAHRSAFVPRVAEREFHTRVEGAFRKIVRHGDHPNEYWWEVTDKVGTKFFYGGTPEDSPQDEQPRDPCAVLATTSAPDPGIFEWALREVRDTHGNSIRYHYDHVGIDDCTLEEPRVSGQELYLSRIEYTLEAGDDEGPYQVVFLRDDQLDVPLAERRKDVIIDGRGGFKRTTAERLRRIEVRFDGRVVRAWELDYYPNAPFYKTLLQSVRQFGVDNAVFPGNVHNFEYENEISENPQAPTAAYKGFGALKSWGSDDDGVEADLGLGNEVIDLVGDDTATGLSGVESTSLGGHVYVGFKAGVGPDKSNSVGFKVGFGSSTSNGVLSFIDIDGDGLPDKVFRDGDTVRYRSNLAKPGTTATGFSTGSAGLFGTSGLSSLFEEESTTFSAGPEGYPAAISIIVNTSDTLTEASTYFSDVNGDGLPDLVNGSRVLFNEGRKNGLHQFTPHDSGATPFPIVAGSVPSGVAPDLSELREENAKRYPLADTIRVWNAPYTGRVRIAGGVSLSHARTAEEAALERLDGVRVAIEHDSGDDERATELWSVEIAPTDDEEKTPEAVDDVSITAGDRLFFRVQSVENGSGDEVTWSPNVEYLDIAGSAVDANGLEERSYGADSDFTLAGRRVQTRVPFRGRVRLEGVLEKPATSDDIDIQVKLNDSVAFNDPHSASEAASIPIDREFDVEAEDAVDLFIAVDSSIAMSGLVFSVPPTLRYVSAEDSDGNPVEVERDGRPIFSVRLAADADLYARQRWIDMSAAPVQNASLPLSAFHIENCRTLGGVVDVSIFALTPVPAPVVLTVKTRGSAGSPGQLLEKQIYATSVDDAEFTIEDAPESADVFFEFFARFDATLGTDVVLLCLEAYDPDQPTSPPRALDVPIPTQVPNMLRAAFPESRCSEPYRGWSYAGYRASGPYDVDGNGTIDDDETNTDQTIHRNLCNDPHPGFVDDDEPTFDEVPEDGLDFVEGNGAVLEDQVITYLFTPHPGGRPCQTPPGSTIPPPPCSVPQVDLWAGPDDLTYLTSTLASSSRLGKDDLTLPTQDDLVQGGSVGGTIVPPAIHRLSVSDQFALGGGASVIGLSFGGSHAEGDSTSELDYLDMNGDGFPDVVSAGPLVFTDPRGALGAVADHNPGIGVARISDTDANSVDIGGTTAFFNSNAEGDGAGKGTEPGETAGTDLQMQPLGLSLGENAGDSEARFDLMDVNGDGLPDRVQRGTGGLSVQLNLGYHFGPIETWSASDAAAINDGNSQQVSASVTLGFNVVDYSFAGGLSASRSSTAIREHPEMGPIVLPQDRGRTLADVNGDALLDLVEPGEGVLRVAINRGADFAPMVDWGGAGGVPDDDNATDVSVGRGTSVGAGAYFTVFIPFFPCPCGLVINPGADGSAAMNRQEMMIQDIDGDGFADYLTSDTDSSIEARINSTGRTNLLRKVTRPLGGSFELSYERTGNTFDHPQSRWVLASVELHDGHDVADQDGGDGPDRQLTTFRYENGFYDRFEREFYGFRTVTTEDRDTRVDVALPPVYRRTTSTFHNQNFFSKGLLERELVEGVAGADSLPFTDTVNTYLLRDVASRAALGGDLGPSAPTDHATIRAAQGAVFPEHRSITRQRHEGVATDFIATTIQQDFDIFGNVTSVVDTGDPADDDTTVAVFGYTSSQAACADSHIVGLATSIQVSGPTGLLRHREADFDCAGATGELRELREFIGNGARATSNFLYQANGNLRQAKGPENLHGQRYTVDFTYDSIVKTHVTSISDSFGHFSSANYDFRFGEQIENVDANAQVLSRIFDAFGRLQSLTGPYEQGGGVSTIRFEYFPERTPPVAVTRHHDEFRDPDSIDTIDVFTFIDGVGRVIQTKKDATIHQNPGANPLDQVIVSGRLVFDHLGRTVEARYPTVEAKNPALNREFTAAPDSIAPHRTAFDFIDRVIQEIEPDGGTTTNLHSIAQDKTGARRLSLFTTDAEGNTRAVFHDVRDQMRASREDNAVKGEQIWTLYAFDAVQQIRGVEDDRGNITSIGYDLLGRSTRVENPDTGRTDFAYDPAGNLIRKVTANLRAQGRSIAYDYHFTRLTDVRYPNFPENDVHYEYGAPELRGDGTNRVGRIVTVSDESGSEERTYGRLGELVVQTKTIASDTQGQSPNSPEVWTTRFLYDTWNRLQQITYPDTEVLTYRYDSGGHPRRATGVKLGVTFAYVETVEYDKFEQRAFSVTGNGIPTVYDYDPADRRLSRLRASTFQDLRYTYDLVGNVTALSNAVSPVTPPEMGGPVEQTFSYDDLYRLTAASGTWHFAPNKSSRYSLSMDYDTIHNITRKDQTHDVVTPGSNAIPQKGTTYNFQYTYGGPRPHAPTTVGTRDYLYDENGNQIRWDEQQSGQRRTLIWDEENRIQEIADNGRTTEYKYDHAGERVIKRARQGETAYINQFWTVRNRSVGTKHVFVGGTRMSSKLSPGEAHVNPPGGRSNNPDLFVGMIGNWFEHRSASGHEHGQNINKNPHITGCVPPRCDSVMPPSDGLPDANFVYFYHPDHLGSTSYVTDKDGELYEHLQYFPFGETWVQESSNTERMPYLFTSKELDEETQLYYFGARYYDPRISLWQSADPILEQSLRTGAHTIDLAPYSYTFQNPLNLIDPDGRQARPPPRVRGGGGGWRPPNIRPPPPPTPIVTVRLPSQAINLQGSAFVHAVRQQMPQITPVTVRGAGEPTGGYVVGRYRDLPIPSQHAQPSIPTSSGGSRPGVERHHVIPTAIGQIMIPGYRANEAPALLMTTREHDITRANWNRLNKQLSRFNDPNGNYTWMDLVASRPELARQVGEILLNGTSVPREARETYFRQFETYRSNARTEQQLQQYMMEYNYWRQPTIGPAQ